METLHARACRAALYLAAGLALSAARADDLPPRIGGLPPALPLIGVPAENNQHKHDGRGAAHDEKPKQAEKEGHSGPKPGGGHQHGEQPGHGAEDGHGHKNGKEKERREDLPPPAWPAQPAVTLTLEHLEGLALARNPTLSQAAARIEMSRGKALQAGLYPNPTVGYQGEQIGAAGTAGELQGGFIQQEIVTAGKLRLSRAKYEQEAVQAEIQALAQEYRVRNGVRIETPAGRDAQQRQTQ